MNDLLLRLRDKGNTVLVVEHEAEVIEIADRVVDMGPGAGQHGGQVVYEGDVAGLRKTDTLTGKHLDRHQSVKITSRTPTGHLHIKDADLHYAEQRIMPSGPRDVVCGKAFALMRSA